ncbi:hypothetical protein KFK09_024264 [Dendrobium nobile]|uniref:Uncharacterized protein n=1 Tax=Dendrobium nobile TaxID=94219 RepID=A0A8T3ADK0_DENNO|nr:hypothetical protein KFK09_024264 [Dendrobium nobile]
MYTQLTLAYWLRAYALKLRGLGFKSLCMRCSKRSDSTSKNKKKDSRAAPSSQVWSSRLTDKKAEATPIFFSRDTESPELPLSGRERSPTEASLTLWLIPVVRYPDQQPLIGSHHLRPSPTQPQPTTLGSCSTSRVESEPRPANGSSPTSPPTQLLPSTPSSDPIG